MGSNKALKSPSPKPSSFLCWVNSENTEPIIFLEKFVKVGDQRFWSLTRLIKYITFLNPQWVPYGWVSGYLIFDNRFWGWSHEVDTTGF
jgi:hypothetical protein